MRKQLVAGNWKMNGRLAFNAGLLESLRARVAVEGVIICPPAPYLAQVQALLAGSPIRWGAQNLSQHKMGAFTGEVSAAMLNDFGCSYVIVGHSERRSLYGESDEVVAEKAATAISARLIPIVCFGETLEERESGCTQSVIERQFSAVARKIGVDGLAASVIAYEPVWAIGTGRTASPEQAQEIHASIRAQAANLDVEIAAQMQILYGGSVKASNAVEIFSMPDVDGGLIGGAALVADDFLAICDAARMSGG